MKHIGILTAGGGTPALNAPIHGAVTRANQLKVEVVGLIKVFNPALYDPLTMKPSKLGMDYPMPIFTDAIGEDDMKHMRRTLFAPGNLSQLYHAINTDVHKRIRYLPTEAV